MSSKASASKFSLIGRGVYSLAEAARLTRVPVKRIRRWSRGYEYSHRGRRQFSPPIVGDSQVSSSILSFADLMEVRLLDAFRERGVSVQTIRKVAQRLSQEFGSGRPFSSRRFLTDGRTILAEYDDVLSKDPVLVDLVNDQVEFRRIVRPLLGHAVDFDDGRSPSRWWPLGKERAVVVDPNRAFGAPIVDRTRIQTAVVASAVSGGQSAAEVADWYSLSADEVSDALEFEESLH
jgi:uncharacterized protein (DUF433 family)/DNA-binding transcriptional MerR regulator